MNWRRGSWRAWLALSVLWLALVAWICSTRWQAEVAATTAEPWEMTWDTPPAQGGVVTVKPVSEWSDDERRRGISAAYWKVAKPWLAWAFIPPATLRVLGVLVGWVIRGFRWRDIQTLT